MRRHLGFTAVMLTVAALCLGAATAASGVTTPARTAGDAVLAAPRCAIRRRYCRRFAKTTGAA